ncbi:MAG: hypothetical protein ACOCXQ_02960 [Patescibacteria group bacterium]
MSVVVRILRYITGGILLLFSLAFFFSGAFAGFLMLLAGALMIPEVSRFVYQHVPAKVPRVAKIGAVAGLFVASTIALPPANGSSLGETTIAPTATPIPTATAIPTATPLPTATAIPTKLPQPSNTPIPTSIPTAIPTTVPPTSTPYIPPPTNTPAPV